MLWEPSDRYKKTSIPPFLTTRSNNNSPTSSFQHHIGAHTLLFWTISHILCLLIFSFHVELGLSAYKSFLFSHPLHTSTSSTPQCRQLSHFATLLTNRLTSLLRGRLGSGTRTKSPKAEPRNKTFGNGKPPLSFPADLVCHSGADSLLPTGSSTKLAQAASANMSLGSRGNKRVGSVPSVTRPSPRATSFCSNTSPFNLMSGSQTSSTGRLPVLHRHRQSRYLFSSTSRSSTSWMAVRRSRTTTLVNRPAPTRPSNPRRLHPRPAPTRNISFVPRCPPPGKLFAISTNAIRPSSFASTCHTTTPTWLLRLLMLWPAANVRKQSSAWCWTAQSTPMNKLWNS